MEGAKMALARSFLKGMGLTDEQISAIIEEHVNTVNGLKDARDTYKADADKLAEVQKELDALKANNGDDWKTKYAAKEKELDDYKNAVAAKERETTIKAAYRKLLVDEHVGDRQLDAVIRATDFSGMEIGTDGNLKNAETLRETIKKDWAGFITTEHVKGANVPTPPTNNPTGGANPRAAELAKKYHEQRYGKTSNDA